MTAAIYDRWDEKDEADRAAQRRAVRGKAIQDLPTDAPEWPAVLADEYAEDESLMLAAAERMERVRQATTAPLRGTGRLAVVEAPTWRSLADVADDPPGELLLGMIEPEGPNLFNAAGGTGKGSTAAWMIRELQGAGLRAMIFDAENRPKEWARRTSGLGVDRSQVVYVQPGDLPRAVLGRPLWDFAPYLGEVAKASGADVLFVDSILAAVGVGEERLKSDAQAPYLYTAALDALGIATISLSHPPKGQPDGDPFGSVAWVNAMRLTWQGTSGEGGGHRVRWRPRKRNERGHIAGVLLTFIYGADGRLSDVAREDDDESTREWILAALTGPPRTVAALAADLLDSLAEPPSAEQERRTEDRIGRAVRRMAADQFIEKVGKQGRADLWALRVRGDR